MLLKVPAHTGIVGNENADKTVKEKTKLVVALEFKYSKIKKIQMTGNMLKKMRLLIKCRLQHIDLGTA